MLISGITSEVAGMISATININTVMARRLVITSVMRSPESGGRKKDNSVRARNNRTKLQCEIKYIRRKWGRNCGATVYMTDLTVWPKRTHFKTLTCYKCAWYYEVDIIIRGTPPYMDCKRDVRIRLGTAHVNDFVPLRRDTNQIPLSIGNKHLNIRFLRFHLKVNSISIVCPGTKLHGTQLKNNKDNKDE